MEIPESQMHECIDHCMRCHRVCLDMAMNFCLERGGEHVAPDHFRLMIDCAEICQTAANFMLSGSRFHKQACAVCATVCDACARSCKELDGMDDCVRACRTCAESCRAMAGDFELLSQRENAERAAARPLV